MRCTARCAGGETENGDGHDPVTVVFATARICITRHGTYLEKRQAAHLTAGLLAERRKARGLAQVNYPEAIAHQRRHHAMHATAKLVAQLMSEGRNSPAPT
jgi:hypothetical protein